METQKFGHTGLHKVMHATAADQYCDERMSDVAVEAKFLRGGHTRNGVETHMGRGSIFDDGDREIVWI